VSDREKFNAWVDPQWPKLSIEEDNRMFSAWQASRRAALEEVAVVCDRMVSVSAVSYETGAACARDIRALVKETNNG
jgi:hypothetical protein